MQILFSYFISPEETATEETLLQEAERLGPVISALPEKLGTLRLETTPPAESIAFFDNLEGLVLAVCLSSQTSLAQGEEYRFSGLTDNQAYRMVPSGDAVAIFINNQLRASFPRAELLPALLRGGERYLAVHQKLYPAAGEPSFQTRILQNALAAGQAALAGGTAVAGGV